MDVIYSGFKITIIGISVVFCTLILIAFLLRLLRNVDAWFGIKKPASETAPAETDIATPASDSLPPEIIVIITAAVASVMDKKHKITRIRTRRTAQSAWLAQGRSINMSGHWVRH
jgi:sodium pump decarboxylase gamma subunit